MNIQLFLEHLLTADSQKICPGKEVWSWQTDVGVASQGARNDTFKTGRRNGIL